MRESGESTSCVIHRFAFSLHAGTVFDQQLMQDRAVAAIRVLAIAAHRKVRRMRERSQHVQIVPGLRPRHLGAILPGKARPLRSCFCCQTEFHRLDAGREIGKPYVIPILGRKLRLRYATGWTSNGAQPRALIREPRRTKADDTNTHGTTSKRTGHDRVKKRRKSKIARRTPHLGRPRDCGLPPGADSAWEWILHSILWGIGR
jgi:hypothetical protein